MSLSKINFYAIKFSPPCQAVLLTAKELGVELNMKVIDVTAAQHLSEDYLKLNPAHAVPVIDDNGFILSESRAIMRYLCNSYAPDSPFYPKDVKQRALVDERLDFDNELFSIIRDAVVLPVFGFPPNEEKMNLLKEKLKILDQIIGGKKYLVADHLTIADLSVLATTHNLLKFGPDLADCLNYKRWITGLMAELKAYKEFCDIDSQEIMDFTKAMQSMFTKLKNQTND